VTFLLDTDICIYAIKRRAAVLERMKSHRRADVRVSVVTEAELKLGAVKSAHPVRNRQVVEAFLLAFEVLDFGSIDADAYAEIRGHLERAGTPISSMDTLLAAHARARNLVLVTNNEREFRRVPGLRIENWSV
jgi:tRNA(fMet)-specific endonuclease VapC